MSVRTWVTQIAAKRIPLIKFRKGGFEKAPASGLAELDQSTAIEDWELPPRFARKLISPEELEYINCGGPA